MRVLETYNSFTEEVDVGRFAFFLKLGKDGVEVGVDDLANDVVNFPKLVIFGDEPFVQVAELESLIKKVVKKKSEMKIEIRTTGIIKPVGIGSIKNVNYNVYLKLKSSGVEYEKRIKPEVINWFAIIGANFIFTVNNYDDIDEVNMLMQEHSIVKSQAFLTVKGEANTEQLKMLVDSCRLNGYNFTLDYGAMFWPKDGRY